MPPPVMPLTERFEQALVYATQLHAAQARKISGVPYIAHLLGVASLALEYGATEDEAIAALLHDAIEDQGGAPTRAEIVRRFGPEVAAIVEGCTDTDIMPKPPWQARKHAYIDHVRTAPAAVRLVSACDKLHNARSIVADLRRHGAAIWSHFNGGRDGTLWYYRTLADIFSTGLPAALSDELNRTVAEMERLVREGEAPAETEEE